jgi:glutamate N-acetyltransferase/amino-acid N-acetyltransferase
MNSRCKKNIRKGRKLGMVIVKGGVTAAKGFEAASAAAGIKYQGRTDMALIYSKKPCRTAGTFTTNVVKAAPVKWDRSVVESGVKSQAVIINSGIANACTGEEGYGYCKETAAAAEKALGVEAEGVLVGSTGVIGMQLPIDKLKNGVREMAENKNASLENGTSAAKAIMTTDTFHKEIAVSIQVGDKTVTIGGMAKGSGMIHPNMCTMLSFITTDAVISKKALQKVLSEDIEDTYNMISVDGDTSTNDTVLLLANGMAENEKIKYKTKEYEKFAEALHLVNEYLAKKIAGDGEGATALFEVKVIGASTKRQAKILAKSIVCSNLTKTAIAGHDANWGRILCAMGYSGAQFDPEKVDLSFESKAGKIQIIENGRAVNYSEEKATEILSQPEVAAIADIKEGTESATAWGCDLTHGYIDINADYRS